MKEKQHTTVTAWTCPACNRTFGARNQSHMCVPVMTLDEYFESKPSWHRPIFDLVRAHLEDVGAITIEPVEVGILLKRVRTFAELRPRRDRLVLSVLLSRRLPPHPRIAKTWHGSGQRSAYFINLREPGDVDADVRDWLTESYLASPER